MTYVLMAPKEDKWRSKPLLPFAGRMEVDGHSLGAATPPPACKIPPAVFCLPCFVSAGTWAGNGIKCDIVGVLRYTLVW